MNLTELKLLAAEAQKPTSSLDEDALISILSLTALKNACTTERIIALVRVAEAAQFAFQQWPTIAFEELNALREALRFALRDLEATP